MAGNTGKMTTEAIRERGPRAALVAFYRYDPPISGKSKPLGHVIVEAEDGRHVISGVAYSRQKMIAGDFRLRVLAMSYSLPYLRRISRGMKGVL